jgi:hypothetical protein
MQDIVGDEISNYVFFSSSGVRSMAACAVLAAGVHRRILDTYITVVSKIAMNASSMIWRRRRWADADGDGHEHKSRLDHRGPRTPATRTEH